MKVGGKRMLPIAAMIFLLTLAANCSVLAASGSLLHSFGHTSVPIWQIMLAGSPVALLVATVATFFNLQTTRAVRRMHARARTVDALQRRVRIADEVAERHRR